MRAKVSSFASKQDSCMMLVRVSIIIAGLTIMAGCGGGSSSSSTSTPTAAVTLSATSLTFAAPISASSLQTVTVTDSGSASLSFTGFSISGTNSGDFTQSNTCGTGISAGANCTVTVTFVSTSAGSGLTGTLSIADNVGTQTVSLSGAAAAPTATLTPAAGLTFSTQGIGSSSSAQAATLTNTGTVPLTISSAPSITGTNAGDFAIQSSTCPASGSTLAATTNNTCTIDVTFTPTASGTATATLTVSDNAGNSPQTISLTGTGATGTVGLSSISLTFASTTEGSTAATQSVTITNTSTTASLTIASIALGGTDSSDFALTTGTNQCTYSGQSLAASANCSVYVNFTPEAAGTLSAAVTITDNSGGVSGSTQNISLTGTGFSPTSNTADLNVSFGLLGQSGGYVNNITTTVTVCVPNTTTCTTIPDVLVDTGSVGLRLLSSGAENVTAGAQVGSLGLPTITDSSTGYPLYECVLFGDLSYTWGQMAYATVTVGSETASQVPAASGGTANGGIPIQIISDETPPEGIGYEDVAYYNPCLGPTYEDDETQIDADTVAGLGSNGILGIGNFPQDCAIANTNECTNISTTTGQYLEYDSAGETVDEEEDGEVVGTTVVNYLVEPTPLNYQAWNPVSAFPVDNTGSIINLPSVPSSGAMSVTGTLTFGIGTETNNAITTQTVYELDADGNFNSAEYNGITYTSANSGGSFLDSGSNALYILDETTLGTSNGVTMGDCIVSGNDIGWYCPTTGTTPEPFDMLPLTLTGYTTSGTNNPSTTLSLVLGNYDTLSATNNAAFNDFAGPSCEGGSADCQPSDGVSPDYIDLGLPFFFGQPNGVFIGISTPSNPNGPYANGYWAF